MTGLDLLEISDFVAAHHRKHRAERPGKVAVLNVYRPASNWALNPDQFCYIAWVFHGNIKHAVL